MCHCDGQVNTRGVAAEQSMELQALFARVEIKTRTATSAALNERGRQDAWQ